MNWFAKKKADVGSFGSVAHGPTVDRRLPADSDLRMIVENNASAGNLRSGVFRITILAERPLR